MDRTGLTGHGSAVQYNVTRHVEASMSICQKSGLFSCGPRQGLRPFMAWFALVVKFCSHSSNATSTPMSFMEELVLKVNLEDPFFTRRYAPKR
jgi:hypothetical protein